MTAVIKPEPAPEDVPQLFYRRGYRYPRAIAWFGLRSFWGHMWHLGASAVATEDIDSRDWMHPDTSEDLTRRIAGVIDAPNPGAASLTEAVDGDVWIDFLADTGDDFSVSRAVAKMLFARYEVEDPDDPGKTLELPRGQIMIFGGDTAYPVATEIEIHNRVVVPFNQILRTVGKDEEPRAILGIPGNHDWYASLDGFGRLFRARRSARLDLASSHHLPAPPDPAQPHEPRPVQAEVVDRLAEVKHFVKWVEAFRVGGHVVKRAALAIAGYTPVQSASYWALRLAPALDLWGVDRQLRAVDFNQRAFFAETRKDDRGVVFCLADPVHAFLEPSQAGTDVVRALDVSIEDDGLLVLTGDTHHYCRQELGKGMHVIAGGGGAFLHPACIARLGLPEPAAEFPGPKVTLALALQVPWQIVHGRSGFLVHMVIGAVLLPTFGVQWVTGSSAPKTSAITTIVAAILCFFLAGTRKKLVKIGLLSTLTGVAIGLVPAVVHLVFGWAMAKAGLHLAAHYTAALTYALCIYTGTLAVGTYLMMLTILGLEQHQAFSALAHPGYKHFVRLRVKKDGTAVDGWVLGRVDPLSRKDKVVLADRFRWKNPKAATAAATPVEPV